MWKKRKQRLYILCKVVVVAIVLGTLWQFGGNMGRKGEVQASSKASEAQLRLIFTTDIHGQLTGMDYETGTNSSVGGLARAYNVIKQARKEVENSMTFDVGDVMYDFTTEYIYSQNQSVLQPIYQAMGIIGYDAITLGNHEFDYEWDYIVNQLKIAGLTDQVVVSNLTDSRTGAYPFNENKIITKELTTTDGKKVSVKVGIIGETFPYLSTKVQDFTGVLNVEPLVSNVTKQAAALKAQGADLVVVLSHSGMGPENATDSDNDASYALTKIPDVDVVLCGHQHNSFPNDSQTGAYYQLKGVDKSTNLANGKLLVMAQDRGRSIGIADLTLTVDNGSVEIVNQRPEVRAVTSANAEEEKSISSLYDEWSEQLSAYSKEAIGSVKDGQTIENYNGLVEDNSAIQLINDAKRAYALNYIHNNKPEYVGYPVIAASSYVSYGGESYLDYVKINGKLTESNLASLQGYNGYTALYKITGAQLKEWLEWTASAYESPNSTAEWTDTTMKSYMSSSGLKSLISDSWLSYWYTFYVFDGVEYTINPTAPARYDVGGNKINTTNRVTSLTYNGQPVKDDQVFVLATAKMSKTCDANSAVKSQGIYKGYVRTQGIIRDYIEQLCKLGELEVKPDYNWRVVFSDPTYKFIVKTTTMGDQLLKGRSWYVKTLGTTSNYSYSVGSYYQKSNNEKPKLIVSETYTDVTSSKVKIAVEATSANGIAEIRYTGGAFDENYEYWASATPVTGNYFYANGNGTYTVYAKDNKGQVTTQQVVVDNIYKDALAKPTLNTYTNRKTSISGKADPDTKIVIATATATYETKTDKKGAFSLSIPAQNSGTSVTVYAVDKEKNYKSVEVKVKVKRTGPNKPYLYQPSNTSDVISGNLNDDDATIVAIVGDQVYCGTKEAAERFKNCSDLYKDTYEIIVTSVTVGDDLEYSLKVPVQEVGTTVAVYNIDHLNRKSMKTSQKVKEKGPNPPKLHELTSIDNKVYGSVESSSNTVYGIYVTIGDNQYTGISDKNGDFSVPVDAGILVPGQIVKVYATDTVGGSVRTSLETSIEVQKPDKFVDSQSSIQIYEMLVGDTSVAGYYGAEEKLYVGICSNSKYTVYETECNANGDFEVTLESSLKSGDKVYVYNRLNYGGIVEMTSDIPIEVVPEKPVIKTTIGNNTKSVQITSPTKGTVALTIGTKSYKTTKAVYNEGSELYTYKISITAPKAGDLVSVTVTNSAGTSKKASTTVKVVVPDTPKVSNIYTTSSKVTGAIQSVGTTKVYVQIGSTTYKATAKATGKFTVKIPETEENTKVTVYGVNSKGTGKKTTVTVKKK